MTRKKKEQQTNGPAEPDFKGALGVILEEVAGDREDISKIQGDLSASWKRVENQFHVNKKAAKDAFYASRLSEETQQDYLRSLFGMYGAFNIALRSDLVDQAEGSNVAQFPTKAAGSGESELVS